MTIDVPKKLAPLECHGVGFTGSSGDAPFRVGVPEEPKSNSRVCTLGMAHAESIGSTIDFHSS